MSAAASLAFWVLIVASVVCYEKMRGTRGARWYPTGARWCVAGSALLIGACWVNALDSGRAGSWFVCGAVTVRAGEMIWRYRRDVGVPVDKGAVSSGDNSG